MKYHDPSAKGDFPWEKFSASPARSLLPYFKSSKMKHNNNPLTVSLFLLPTFNIYIFKYLETNGQVRLVFEKDV